MSVLVALTAPHCAAVAVDRRKIGETNDIDDRYEKSFCLERHDRTVIGGFVGMLETPSGTVLRHVENEWTTGASTLSDFAHACAESLRRSFQGFTEGLTLALVGAPDLGRTQRAIIYLV